MSVMRVINLHPYTKLEEHHPSRSKDMSDFGHCINWLGDLAFDLSTSKCNYG